MFFSARGPHSIVLASRTGRNTVSPQPLRLPPFGIAQVPTGCTAGTEDWVFPANLEGKVEVSLEQEVVPSTHTLLLNKTSSRPNKVITLPEGNSSSLDQISELLRRNAEAQASAEVTEQQIERLLVETNKDTRAQTRYPYELAVGLFIGAIVTLLDLSELTLLDVKPTYGSP